MNDHINSFESPQPNHPEMGLRDWVITVFLSFLPLIGLVMLIVWSLNDHINPNKRNWARAVLIVYLIFTVLYLLFILLFAGTMMSGMEEMYRM